MLDPTSLRLWHARERGLPGTEDLLRPVLLYKGRGTRCPVCSSRDGSYDDGPIQGVQPVPTNEGPDWDAARAEGCESPQELNLLRAIRANELLPEPNKQHEVWDGNRVLTRADFAYLDREPKLLIYVDGLAWHSSIRQRSHDNRITNRLQTVGYRVLRFLGSEVQNAPEKCVAQIWDARSDSHGTPSHPSRLHRLDRADRELDQPALDGSR